MLLHRTPSFLRGAGFMSQAQPIATMDPGLRRDDGWQRRRRCMNVASIRACMNDVSTTCPVIPAKAGTRHPGEGRHSSSRRRPGSISQAQPIAAVAFRHPD
jgi:hypothetical protein